jgi:hypothetical protein
MSVEKLPPWLRHPSGSRGITHMVKKTTRFGRRPLLGLIVILVGVGLASGARGAEATGTLEDLFTAVAMEMPEFGGMYVDEEKDTLYVYWRDGSEPAAPEIEELRAILGDMDLPGKVQVLPASFGFLELKQWHDSMAEHVLKLPGVTLIGIDDANNQLLIGVEDSQALDLIGRVEQQLAELDIPREAVNLIEVGPMELDTSLNDHHRPLVGGLKIIGRFQPRVRPDVLPPTEVETTGCTLGFNAIRRGVSGFVTNSHCSARLGRVDSTIYYQPEAQGPAGDVIVANQIGIETVDPPFRRSLGCFLGTVRCRNSDSNFSRLAGPIVIDDDVLFPVDAALGFIARPALGAETWDGVSRFRIIAERTPVTGASVTKVGQVTGRTQGTVRLRASVPIRIGIVRIGIPRVVGIPPLARPVSFPVFGLLVLRNQVLATYDRAGGDSGAPVIGARAPDPPGNPIDTSLAGIHRGFIGPFAVFSPIRGVEADLGPLNTCAPPLAC